MRVFVIIVGIILMIALVSGAYLISARNSFVKLNEEIDARYAQVENQLKRRADLIPNLVNTVKGYARHEREIFEKLFEARARMMGARTPSELFSASNDISQALSRLMVVVENYPNLKADVTFTRLMDELAGTENRISVERMRYNEAVKSYNVKIKMFPSNMVASFFGFQPRPYFEVSAADRQTPQVEFK